MGRRKIRVYGTNQYDLPPDEVLVFPGLVMTGEPAKPRFGRGSGRAGGARSTAHAKHHLHLVGEGTTVESCPVCRFGMEVWRLWKDSIGGISEEWLAYWECDPEGEREFLGLVGRGSSRSMENFLPKVGDDSPVEL